MNIDEKAFFQEMTLCICSSLEIDVVLNQTLRQIKKFIPADQILLSYFDTSENTVVLLATASVEGGNITNSRFVASKDEQEIMKDINQFPELLLLDDASKYSIPRRLTQLAGKANSSAIFCRLKSDEKWLGTVSLLSDQKGGFNQYHLYLLSLLKEPWAIALSNSRRYLELLELKELLADDNRYLHRELQHQSGDEIVGADNGLSQVVDLVRQVSPLNSPVLLLGETGVGKEIIAGTIHKWSNRKNGPFIKVNCSVIPDALVDSELFGIEKSDFSETTARVKGKFERAADGTIFLDEIGELPLHTQERLLRVIQEKKIEHAGGLFDLDIRIIAATHRNLEEMVKTAQFREDLWYRLNVSPIHIPPLRYRKSDIRDLAIHFLHKIAIELGYVSSPVLSENAIENLEAYHWPGNVRELENTIERALILNKKGSLDFDTLGQSTTDTLNLSFNTKLEETLDLNVITKSHISRVLKLTAGKIAGKKGAAELMGIKPSTLRHRMRKLGITYGRRSKNA